MRIHSDNNDDPSDSVNCKDKAEISAYNTFLVNKIKKLTSERCIETLLNCFYRETLASRKYVQILNKNELENCHLKIPQALVKHTGLFMKLKLNNIHTEIIIAIRHDSKIGFCHYQSCPYAKSAPSDWKILSYYELAMLLIEELAQSHQQSFNDELLNQIQNSVQTMSYCMQYRMQFDKEKSISLNFIHSEQSLLWGHSFHPSPKSREGFTLKDILEFSPEVHANFSLYYFSVKKDYIVEHTLLDKSAVKLVQENSPNSFSIKDNHVLICTHPWEACYLKQLPLVKAALQHGYLEDIGQRGEKYFPTSSIRTVYHPHNPFFYKLSLHVRITNCIRKNAIYELKTAVSLTKCILTKMEELKQKFPDFHILLEPAYLSLKLPEGSAEEQQQVTEGFGMIFRQNFTSDQLEQSTPLLTGMLFGNASPGSYNIHSFIKRLSTQLKMDYNFVVLEWFNLYVEKLIYPLLYCHFNLGITFEPHLQNVLVGIKNDRPFCIYVRDLEGTKLNADYWPENYLTDLNKTEKQSVYYSEQMSWNRIAYCLLVNNIGEAIFYCSNGCLNLEQKLWEMVRNHLLIFQEKYGNQNSAARIHGLLTKDPLPIKNNLMTRFLKRADKKAVYGFLNIHPLLQEQEMTIPAESYVMENS